MNRLLIFLALYMAQTFAVVAAQNAWVGTWQKDSSKSHYGQVFSYTQTPDGMMHSVDGTNVTDFRIDGKPYSSGGIHTSTWTATGANSWQTVHKAGDVTEAIIQRSLSQDGQAFTITADGGDADGSKYHDTSVYTRVSGTGLLGTWRCVKYETSSPFQIIVLPAATGTYRALWPSSQTSIEGRTDGSQIPMKGPQMSPGATISMIAVSPHVFRYTRSLDGKARYHGTQTLANDEKSFTETSWTDGNEAAKSTYVFIKQ